MNLPNTPAIARLSTILGVSVPSRIRDLVNPFLFDLPDAVLVTATPPAEPGQGSSYQMTVDEPHVRLVTDDTLLVVTLPDMTKCESGQKFSLLLTQGEGGSDYALLSGYGTQVLIGTGVRYQFVAANGNNLTMLNDWMLWGSSILRIADIIGGKNDSYGDGSVWGAINGMVADLTDVQTITLSGVLADDTIVVLGEELLCVASDPGANEFAVGLSDSATATNLAALINGMDGLSASAQNAVVTVSATVPSRPVKIVSGGESMVVASADYGNIMGAFHLLYNAITGG